jgi:uncharacterized membrane protein
MRTTSAASRSTTAVDGGRPGSGSGGATVLAVALALTAILWTGLVGYAPVAASGRAPASGQVVAAMTYFAGSLVCHQRPERSFHLHGSKLAVCARCTGLYVGGALGLAVALRRARRRSTAAVRAALALALLPIAASVGLEWAGLLETSNLVRFLTGLPAGFVGGAVVNGSLRLP